MNRLGIDVRTKDANKLMSRLRRLKSTISIEYGGAYWEDLSYSQIHITTTLSESGLDDWLYRVNHRCEYVGTFDRSEKC